MASGIFEALTQHLDAGYLLSGGFQWKCASALLEDGTPTNHLMASLAGDSDTCYAVGNHLNDDSYDAAVIIPDDQPQITPSNLICHCGQPLAKG